MFEEYIIKEEDLDIISEAIACVWKSELDFIFQDKKRIEKTNVITYDSKNLFILGHDKEPRAVPHKIKLLDKFQKGWRASILKEFTEYLPRDFKYDRFNYPAISGGLPGPFMGIHKSLRDTGERKYDAYYTKESYLATIVHEYAHVYYHSFKRWWFSNLAQNLEYLDSAIKLFANKDTNIDFPELYIPSPHSIAEVFAFCTDYTAAEIFWPVHKKDLDIMHTYELKKIRNAEKKLDLERADSYLNSKPHTLAAVFGKILLQKYPNKWVAKLLSPLQVG